MAQILDPHSSGELADILVRPEVRQSETVAYSSVKQSTALVGMGTRTSAGDSIVAFKGKKAWSEI